MLLWKSKELPINKYYYIYRTLKRQKSMAKKFTMSLPDSMNKAIEKEREKRKLGTVQETIRFILAEYLKERNS
jgi:hypothetical protein